MKSLNIGFVSTRFAGTDGVSLETDKWARIFEEMGHHCCYFAGELDRPAHVSYLMPEAHFTHPRVMRITEACFGADTRDQAITQEIHTIKRMLKKELYTFIDRFNIHLLVPENCLAIPVNIPLGIALSEIISETGMPAVAHHHDFAWERKRFLRNSIHEYLSMAFPPILPTMRHAVISTYADSELSYRTGISATVVPNVMDFETPPPGVDDYNRDVRQALGIADDELLVLQPTRVVQRKGIEHAIELVSRLDRKARLVISHASGDEGRAYEQRVRDYAVRQKVDTVFVAGRIDEKRRTDAEGKKVYTLADVYPHADLVTYPSTYEGFGNAFLEAIYFRKPLVVNNYTIYATDIKPKGFKVVEFDDYVTDETVRQVHQVLDGPEATEQMCERNFALGVRHFSFKVLREKLRYLLVDSFGALE